MGHWEISEVVLAGSQPRGEHVAVEATGGGKVDGVTAESVELEECIVHPSPLGEQHALPQLHPARPDRRLHTSVNPVADAQRELVRGCRACVGVLVEQPSE